MLRLQRSAGTALAERDRARFEAGFGAALADVRLHTGRAAGEAAAMLGARAFTAGSNVVFAEGQYAPGTATGRDLLAHELGHVIQQRTGRVASSRSSDVEISDESALEHEASEAGVRATFATAAAPSSGWGATVDGGETGGTAVHRPPAPQVIQRAPAQGGAEPGGGGLLVWQLQAGNRATAHLAERLRLRGRTPAGAPWSREPPIKLPGDVRLLEDEIVRPAIVDDPYDLLAVVRARDAEAVSTAVARVNAALAPITGTPNAQGLWDNIVEQVDSPTTKVQTEEVPSLYDADVVSAIRALGPHEGGGALERQATLRRKSQVLRTVLTTLLAAREKVLGEADLAPGDPQAELDGELNDARRYIGSAENYRQIRLALLHEFGALTVGTSTALARANAYYRDKIVEAWFLGNPVWVHDDMATRLDNAAKALSPTERRDLAPSVASIGGIAVRPNVNEPLLLSEHSFGAAIDVNAESSPNVPGFPTDLVRKVTGIDVMVDKAGVKKGNLVDLGPADERGRRARGTQGQVQPEAERIRLASVGFTAAFRDEASLGSTLLKITRERARPPAGLTPSVLLVLVRGAAAEGSAPRWRVPTNVDLQIEIGQRRDKKGNLRPRGVKHEELANLIYPPRESYYNPEPITDTVATLVQLVEIYEATFEHDEHGARKMRDGEEARVPPTARSPSLGQLARHGFLGIPERLIAVLAGADAGNLRWLGGLEKNLKDSMHFELRPRPKLY